MATTTNRWQSVLPQARLCWLRPPVTTPNGGVQRGTAAGALQAAWDAFFVVLRQMFDGPTVTGGPSRSRQNYLFHYFQNDPQVRTGCTHFQPIDRTADGEGRASSTGF